MSKRCETTGSKYKRYKGISLVWIAVIFLIFVIPLLVLALDWGIVNLVRHQLQNAADAAALAGAQVVKYDESKAISSAITIAARNYAEKLPVALYYASNDSKSEVVLGRWIRQEGRFYPTTISPNAVKVYAKRPGMRGQAEAPSVSIAFGVLVGTNFKGVKYAKDVSQIATGFSTGSTGAGIITLASDPTSLPKWNHATGFLLNGGSTVDLRGVNPLTGEPMMGDIQINATSTNSPWEGFRLSTTGQQSADIYAGELNIVGSSNPGPDDAEAWKRLFGDTSLPFSVNPEAPRIDDPLAGLTPPDISKMPIGTDTNHKTYSKVNDVVNGTVTLNPGYYPGGINSSSGAITLNPGVYAFGGGNQGKNGMVLGGSASLLGNGVMCYVTGDPTGKITGTKVEYGLIDMHGSTGNNTGKVVLTSRGDAMLPPEINGEMGVAIWQDRNNPSYGTVGGGADTIIKGVIYCGYNAMKVAGNPGQVGNQLIVGALEVAGKVSLGIAYDGRNTVEAKKSYLVE